MQECSNSSGSFQVLPDETVLHLLQFFSGQELEKISSVCQRFHRLSSDKCLPRAGEAMKQRAEQRAIKIIDQIREQSLHNLTTKCESPGYLDERGMFHVKVDYEYLRVFHSFTLVWAAGNMDILWFENYSPNKEKGKLLLKAIYATSRKALKGAKQIKQEKNLSPGTGNILVWEGIYAVLSDPKTYPTSELLEKAKVLKGVKEFGRLSISFPSPGYPPAPRLGFRNVLEAGQTRFHDMQYTPLHL